MIQSATKRKLSFITTTALLLSIKVFGATSDTSSSLVESSRGDEQHAHDNQTQGETNIEDLIPNWWDKKFYKKHSHFKRLEYINGSAPHLKTDDLVCVIEADRQVFFNAKLVANLRNNNIVVDFYDETHKVIKKLHIETQKIEKYYKSICEKSGNRKNIIKSGDNVKILHNNKNGKILGFFVDIVDEKESKIHNINALIKLKNGNSFLTAFSDIKKL